MHASYRIDTLNNRSATAKKALISLVAFTSSLFPHKSTEILLVNFNNFQSLSLRSNHKVPKNLLY
jgi:hypothetical protein